VASRTLGLALADLSRVLARIEPPETREYFERLTGLARAVLTAIAMRDA
jgi:hypothetical protein